MAGGAARRGKVFGAASGADRARAQGTPGWRRLAAAGSVALLLAWFLAFLPAPAMALDYPDKLRLVEMLRAGAWTKLERRLEAYQSAFVNGRASDELVESAYFAFANSDQALAEKLDEWVDASPNSYAARAARGVYFWRLGWIARGTEVSHRPLRQQARTMRGFFGLANQDFEAAIDLNPQFSVGYAFLISIGMASNQRDDQIFTMRRGLDVVPRSFTIRERFLASLEPWWRPGVSDDQALAMIDEFVRITKKAAKRYPRLGPLVGYGDYVRAQMHFRTGQYTKALSAVNRALAAGEYWRYLDLRGRIDYREQRCVLALQSYDRALARRPQMAAVYRMRGQVRRCVDNFEGALEEWDRALALDAMDPNSLLGKGEALQRLGRYDDAREMLDKAIFYGAYDPAVRATRGALLANDFDQAEAALEDLKYATDMLPEHASYWRDYGYVLLQSNRCDAAAALATYLRLCKAGEVCTIDDMEWAAGGIEDITRADCEG